MRFLSINKKQIYSSSDNNFFEDQNNYYKPEIARDSKGRPLGKYVKRNHAKTTARTFSVAMGMSLCEFNVVYNG